MARNRKLPVSTREGFVHQLRAGILRTQKTTNAYLKRHKGLSYSPTVMAISEELSCRLNDMRMKVLNGEASNRCHTRRTLFVQVCLGIGHVSKRAAR